MKKIVSLVLAVAVVMSMGVISSMARMAGDVVSTAEMGFTLDFEETLDEEDICSEDCTTAVFKQYMNLEVDLDEAAKSYVESIRLVADEISTYVKDGNSNVLYAVAPFSIRMEDKYRLSGKMALSTDIKKGWLDADEFAGVVINYGRDGSGVATNYETAFKCDEDSQGYVHNAGYGYTFLYDSDTKIRFYFRCLTDVDGENHLDVVSYDYDTKKDLTKNYATVTSYNDTANGEVYFYVDGVYVLKIEIDTSKVVTDQCDAESDRFYYTANNYDGNWDLGGQSTLGSNTYGGWHYYTSAKMLLADGTEVGASDNAMINNENNVFNCCVSGIESTTYFDNIVVSDYDELPKSLEIRHWTKGTDAMAFDVIKVNGEDKATGGADDVIAYKKSIEGASNVTVTGWFGSTQATVEKYGYTTDGGASFTFNADPITDCDDIQAIKDAGGDSRYEITVDVSGFTATTTVEFVAKLSDNTIVYMDRFEEDTGKDRDCYVVITVAEPEVTEAPENTEVPEATEEPADVTEAPAETTAPEATAEPEKKTGCGSIIGGTAAVLLAATVLVIKKKD